MTDDIDRELADLIREWKANQKARQALGAKLAAAVGLLARFQFAGVDVRAVATETRLDQMEGWDELLLNAKASLSTLE